MVIEVACFHIRYIHFDKRWDSACSGEGESGELEYLA